MIKPQQNKAQQTLCIFYGPHCMWVSTVTWLHWLYSPHTGSTWQEYPCRTSRTEWWGSTLWNWPLILGWNMYRFSEINSRVSCQKGPTRHAYAWLIGPFWQDTFELYKWPYRYPNKWVFTDIFIPNVVFFSNKSIINKNHSPCNSWWPCTIWQLRPKSSLVQVMTCHLFSAKPLSDCDSWIWIFFPN